MTIQNFNLSTSALRTTFLQWFDQWKAGELQRPFAPAPVGTLYDDYLAATGNARPKMYITRFVIELGRHMLIATHRQRGRALRFAVPKPTEATPYPVDERTASTAPAVLVMLPLAASTYQELLEVVESCNLANKKREGCTSHGKLDVEGLITMLAEDAAMTNSRPGSWEGANMQHVLNCHGYM